MADNAVLYKYLAKSLGMKHGVLPSFMAKPWGNVSSPSLTSGVLIIYHDHSSQDVVGEPRSKGEVRSSSNFCFRHVHVSLRDDQGRNVFAPSGEDLVKGRSNAAYADTRFVSQEGEWFLAGVLDGIADGQ